MTHEHSRPSAGTALLFSGSLLIVIALLVLVSSSWESFSPTGRVITACLPLITLYTLGFTSRRTPGQERLSLYTILTGSIIFPLVLGAVLFQSGLYPYVDANLVFIISLVSLLVYLGMQFAANQTRHAALIVIAGISLMYSFAGIIEASSWVYSLLTLLLGYFLLALAWYLGRPKMEDTFATQIFSYSGLMLGLYGIVTLPLYLLANFSDWAQPSSYTGLYVIVSAILFAVAVTYSRRWQNLKLNHDLAIRQASEVASAIALTVPAIIACLWSSSSVDTLIALLCGVAAVCLSTYVRIPALRQLGIVTIIIALIRLIVLSLTHVAAFWPILLLVAGFVLIGLAYAVQRLEYRRILTTMNRQPTNSLFGLGINPEPHREETEETTVVSHSTDGTVQFVTGGRTSWWPIFWTIVLILVGLRLIASLISY